ncbi:MAG TPA: sugar transferase [Sphingomonadaceae bacterium]|nr:sugar transferase [Sphingomonadaceae bacterium]
MEKRRFYYNIFQISLDPATILFSFWLSSLVYFGSTWDDRTQIAAILVAGLFFFLAAFGGTYTTATLTDWKQATLRMVLVLGATMILFAFVAFYTKTSASFSRGAVSIGIVFSAALMATTRFILTRWLVRNYGPTLTNEIVIMDGGPQFGLRHAAAIDAQSEGIARSFEDPVVRDRLGRIIEHMDHVIVSCAPEKRLEWAKVLKSLGVNGEIISAHAHEIGAIAVRNYDRQGLTSLVVSTGPLGMRARFTKRAFDLAVASIGLVLAAPLMLLAALAIIAEDGPPLIFRQRRVGRKNREFTIYKFRTMKAAASDADGHRSTIRDDERVTRVGRILRRTSIDELPQLFNVLKGEMSMVGPRPHAPGSRVKERPFWQVDQRYAARDWRPV